jgi:anti-sigma factor RsiW
MNDAIKMQISAFVDGELPQNESELLLRRLCQDVELRQQTAEYLEMGRIIRGERMVAGRAVLRERIAAAIDDKDLQQDSESTETGAPRFVRPLAGVAIAASVALLALLGLQQVSDVPSEVSVSGDTVAGAEVDSYTVPEREEDPLRDYYLIHEASQPKAIFPRLIYESRDAADFDELTNGEFENDEQDNDVGDSAESVTP